MSEAAALRDPERALALAYVPAARRGAVAILWALDEALGRVVAAAREPLLTQLRLAWWRDALVALDDPAAPPPVDPLLRAVGARVVPTVPGASLAEITEGWSALLGELDPETHARQRGAVLFEVTAALLGVPDWRHIARAGEVWALVDIAEDAFARARIGGGADPFWPKPLRPLGMLAALAVADARSGRGATARGGPGRVARMIAHRLTGRAGLGGGATEG